MLGRAARSFKWVSAPLGLVRLLISRCTAILRHNEKIEHRLVLQAFKSVKYRCSLNGGTGTGTIGAALA